MQPNFTHNTRQRPLQKSMFLPTTQQYQNRNNSVQYQYQDIMKRSSINPDTNTPHNFHNNQNNNNFPINPTSNFQQINQNNVQSPVHQFNLNQNPVLNFNSTPRHKQNTKFNQFDRFNNQHDNSIMQQINQKIQKLSILVQNHDQILKRNNPNNFKQQKSSIDTKIQQTQSKIRQSILPSLINKETKQIYQHIFNFKVQINSLKQQVLDINKYQEQIKIFINMAQSNKSPKKLGINVNNTQNKAQQPLDQINGNIFSLQKKLQQIQKNMALKDQQIKSFIQSQFDKNRGDIQFSKSSPKLKQSTIQSTLNPIMIEYQQLFVIKNTNSKSNITKINISNKNKQQTEILINSTNYYIDKEGYLLDNQNRYIVDSKGLQIKLQQKHLNLLKLHHVLN